MEIAESESNEMEEEVESNETTIEAENTEPTNEIPKQTEESEEGSSDQPSPEFLQRKLYFLVEHLKTMHSKLPE